AKTLITLGESEVESGQVTVKNNQTREEVQVSLETISQNFSEIFEKLGFYTQ
ncbi:His/Gly/Thr/Pro-type tRNA ligase C-terminal domain-containing protein, partial [Streptococcus pneumoniae]